MTPNKYLLAGMAVLALIPHGARAQASTASTATAEESSLGEIVVTAERRSERLRDVPISVTAVTGESLERAGVVGTIDLQKVTPGFFLYMNGGFAQPVIRGVSSGGSSPGDNSNVAVYIDGVYLASQAAQLFDLPDVERIEVLKGPQGTLFGRNAAAGAVRILTLEPSLNAFTGRFSASYGNFNDQTYKAFVSGPLSDKIAFSLSGLYANIDGWNRDIVTGERVGGIESSLIRAKLLVEPMDSLKFVLSGFYTKRNDHSVFTGNAGPRAVTIAYQPFPGLPLNTSLYEPYKPYEVAVNRPVGAFIETYGGSLTGTYQAGFGTFNSVTALTAGKVHQLVDADYSPVPVFAYDEDSPNHATSEEFTFSSSQFGPLSFTAGVFYFKAREGYDPLKVRASTTGPIYATLYGTLKTEAEAIFGEAYLNATDHLQLIGGLRYSNEKKESFANFVGNRNAQALQGEGSFNSVTPRASIKYALTDTANVYYTYSEGFKSGGFDPLTSGAVPVQPEKNSQHEIGLKAGVLPGLDLSIAGFYTKYKDIQVQTLVRCPAPGEAGYNPNCIPTAHLENAGAATIYGTEFNLAWTVTPDINLTGGFTVLKGKYDSYKNATTTLFTPALNGAGNPVIAANGLPILLPSTGVGDVSGNTTYRTPRFTANGSAAWGHNYSFGRLGVNANVYHSSSWFVDPFNTVKQEAYTTLDAQASFQPVGTNVHLILWTKNLTDAVHVQSFLIQGNAFGYSYAEPRSYGGRVEYSF